MALRKALPNGTTLFSEAYDARADIPVLLGLDVISTCGLILDSMYPNSVRTNHRGT